jgi:5'-3' exonuclease
MDVNIDEYRLNYHKHKLNMVDAKKISHQYLEGMCWVINYYIKGVPDWKWFFPYHYAPMCSMLCEHIDMFIFKSYTRTISSTPFQQLLSVLPPKSAHLLPSPLNKLLTDDNSSLKKNCPTDFKIDLSGKRKEWEGIVILPMVNFDLIRVAYLDNIQSVSKSNMKRNIEGHSFSYLYDFLTAPYTYTHKYGSIHNYKVNIEKIDI